FRLAGDRTGAGRVRAKTGTLSGVSALAGVVRDTDGRLLVFAVLADRVPAGGTDGAEIALDRVAAALAGCGCR
ncbi:MAG: D-alanyl-D-alanine carboxypeptidase, partial [Actinomycetota bacterium]|nr:D-alanyl-D-alanine carboxypeptidase [Actinomycetota bacterium]